MVAVPPVISGEVTNRMAFVRSVGRLVPVIELGIVTVELSNNGIIPDVLDCFEVAVVTGVKVYFLLRSVQLVISAICMGLRMHAEDLGDPKPTVVVVLNNY